MTHCQPPRIKHLEERRALLDPIADCQTDRAERPKNCRQQLRGNAFPCRVTGAVAAIPRARSRTDFWLSARSMTRSQSTGSKGMRGLGPDSATSVCQALWKLTFRSARGLSVILCP